MEILRKTQGINSFLQINIRQQADSLGYEEKMLRNNRLKSLPPLSFQQVDDDLYILYKVDGKTSLPRSWCAGGPGRAEVQRLLSDLAYCVRELQDYLLLPERLVLSLPYILYDGVSGRTVFLYVPEPGPTFSESMKRLFEEIMPIYSAEREEEQIWFYELYSRFLDDSFTPAMLLSLTAQWSRPVEAGRTTGEGMGMRGISGGGVPLPLNEDTDPYAHRGHEPYNPRKSDPYDLRDPDPYDLRDPASHVRQDPDPYDLRDQEPYILQEADVKTGSRALSGFRVPAGILVAVLAVVLYLWLGAASFRISALLVAGYAVMLILPILTGEREKPAVCNQNAGRKQEAKQVRQETKPSSGTDRPSSGEGRLSTDVLRPRIERLVPVKGELRMPLFVSEGYCRIGRSEEENEYCIPAPSISRNHARLECVGDVVTLRDLGSTNGTYLNHMRLPGETVAELHCGDVVSFAGEEFYVV